MLLEGLGLDQATGDGWQTCLRTGRDLHYGGLVPDDPPERRPDRHRRDPGDRRARGADGVPAVLATTCGAAHDRAGGPDHHSRQWRTGGG